MAKKKARKTSKGRASKKPQVLYDGRFLRLLDRGGWEYAERTNASAVVVVAAVTEDRRLLLVEQYRPALDARVLEMPAGLVGDLPGEADEDLVEAARRELLEETGYEAERLEVLTAGPSSSGSSNEVLTFLFAPDVRRVAAGGGDGSEDIQVHAVPLAGIDNWLENRRQGGVLLDPKVYAGLYFLRQRL